MSSNGYQTGDTVGYYETPAVPAKILKVHRDDETTYYTIRIIDSQNNVREINTVDKRLCDINQ